MNRKKGAGRLLYGGPHAVLWKIGNFPFLLNKMQVCIVSPSFSHGNKNWCIEVCFRPNPKITCDTENWVCVSTSPKTHLNVRHFIYKCAIRKGNGGLYSCINFTEFYLNTAYLIPVSEFFNNKAMLAPNSNVTFMVEFRLECDRHALEHSILLASSRRVGFSSFYLERENHFKCLDILSENIKELYLRGLYCDISFQVREKEFQGHKIILASRSPVFATMIEQNVKQENGKVNVNCEPDVFHKFLLYMYSGKVETLSSEGALGLYILADRFKVDGLKAVCIDCMKQTVCVDNFCEIAELASKHKESDLLKDLKNYFIKNVKSIFSNGKWNAFMKENIVLVKELLLLIVSNYSSD